MTPKKISWKSLEHYEGSAVKVPKWAESLAGGDYLRGCTEIEQAFVQPGKACTAAAPTVSLLIEAQQAAKKPEWVLRAIANIAGNDQLWAWLRAPEDIAEDVAQVLVEQRQEIFEALKHEREAVRSAAAFVLGVAPRQLAAQASALLEERISADSSAQVIASAALALSRLQTAKLGEALAHLSSHESALVRGAGALARLRADPNLELEPLLDGLIHWLGVNTKPAAASEGFWWWSRSPRFAYLKGFLRARLQNAVVLGELAKHRGTLARWTPALLSVPQRTEDGWAYRGATDCLAFAYGFTEIPSEEIRKPSALSELQHGLARQIVDSQLFASAGHGLPASGAVRRRWLGLDPASVLETLVDFEGRKEPLYWVWQQQTHGSDPLPQVESLPAAARWLVHVSDITGEYNEEWVRPQDDTVEAMIAAAAADPGIVGVGPARASEAAQRFVECQRQEIEFRYNAESCAMILVPLCRAGVPWDPKWTPLLCVDSELPGLNRELIAWMPPEQREAWLWENQQRQRYEVAFVDLLPSARLVERALLTLQEARDEQDEGDEIPETSLELERKVHELAKTVPHFAQGVKGAKAKGYKGIP